MKKLIFILVLWVTLTSCSRSFSDENPYERRGNYILRCIDGVEYLEGYRTLTPHFKPDGTLYTCEDNND